MLLLRCCFCNRLQVGQTFFKLAADHCVAVHEEAKCLRDEIVFAGHGPSHLGLAALRLGSGNGLAHDLATAAAFFAVLQLASDPAGCVTRVLSAPWLVRIGLFSYSIYLVHAPLLHLSWFALRRFELSDDLNFVILTILVLPVIVGVSYIFHLWFERPFMRMPAKDKKVQSYPGFSQ